MKTYLFQVELEQDAEGWRAFYPAWESLGASTWGTTKAEAWKHIQEVLTMIIEECAEEEQPIPTAVWSEQDLRRLGLLSG